MKNESSFSLRHWLCFTENDPYYGINLDHCYDFKTEELDHWAGEIVEQVSSYTEVSPSGKGVNIILKGKTPFGRNKSPNRVFEIYESRRYFTMPGGIF